MMIVMRILMISKICQMMIFWVSLMMSLKRRPRRYWNSSCILCNFLFYNFEYFGHCWCRYRIVNWIFLYVEGWIGQEETLWICNKNSCPHKKGKSSHSSKDRWFCLFLCIIDLKHLILSWFFVIYLFFKIFYLFSEYSMISQVSLSLSLCVFIILTNHHPNK